MRDCSENQPSVNQRVSSAIDGEEFKLFDQVVVLVLIVADSKFDGGMEGSRKVG
jgi:hypothetical protein